ncbi:MAG: DUF3488 domain-containing protein [Desulfofustis sp. PB-SRB1]|jgi:transglutaminase-like putative cysteine protease|nr:DUF3488 domain-containing protein [Desulfofustis sp. PB-SRB1]
MIAKHHNKRPDPTAVLVGVVLCSVPHFLNISIVATLICLLLWSYQVLSLKRSLPVPGLLVRSVAGTVMFLIAVGLNEGLTLEAFVTLLIFMITVKTFELRTRRDQIVTIILCYFLIFSAMFFNDSFILFAYLLFTITCLTAGLISVSFAGLRPRRTMRLAGRLLLQAIPFMIVLFLFFPRMQSGLWGRPPVISQVSGFTDEVTFDSFANIAQSGKTAFRVTFDTEIPQPEQRYWRGIVLSRFDGRTWREDRHRPFARGVVNSEQEILRYTVTLEPHNHRTLFTLDLPFRIYSPRARLQADYTYQLWRPLSGRIQYEARSQPGASQRAGKTDVTANIGLPETGNSRVRALASQLRAESSSPVEFVQRTLFFFQNGDFTYSLNPAPIPADRISQDGIDAFIFDTREGFCEHFASAFAVMMRAGGVAARLVGGYMGGEMNPYGDYMVVRQSDAHVWCEVLIDGVWQRIDPTVAVAPGRALQNRAGTEVATGAGSLLNVQLPAFADFFSSFTNYTDMLNMRWNQWVLSYSRANQVELFRAIGIDIQLPGGVVLAVVVGGVLLVACGFIAIVLVRDIRTRDDDGATYWRRFCAVMKKEGLPKPAHQGPIEYGRDIVSRRPDLQNGVAKITALYSQLRYNPTCTEDTLPRFIEAVKSFRPSPKKRQR